jgi:hypothetical protein
MSVETASVTEGPPNGNTSALQGDRQSAKIRYSDRVDVSEIFADSITSLVVDNQLMRIEFGITRLDEMKANSPLTGRRYPACRVVLSPAAALDLVNRLRRVAAIFAQLAKAAPQPETEPAKQDYTAPAAFEQACLSP